MRTEVHIRLRPFLIGLLSLGIAVAPLSAAFADGPKKSPSMEGSLSTRYKYRNGLGESDQDLQSVLNLNFGNSRFDKFSAAFQVGGVADLDGSKDGSYFNDIYQTFHQAVVPRLYYAYATIRHLGDIDQVRIGRQRFIQMEPYYLDGVVIETVPLNGVVLSAFGGIPVHLYENVLGTDTGDWLAGGAIQWTPLSSLRFRFEMAHENDNASGFNASRGNLSDNLLGASAWWVLSKHVDIYGRVTSYTNQPRDVQASSTFSFPEKKITIRVNAQRLLAVEKVHVSDWDDFKIAGSYRPYTQVGVTVTKGIGAKFALDGGADLRILDATQAGTAFNHGYRRFFLTASSHDWLAKNLSLSLSGNYYNGTDNTLRNDNAALSFSISKRFFYGQVKPPKPNPPPAEPQPAADGTLPPVATPAPAEPPPEKPARKKSSFKRYVNVDAGTGYYLYRYNLLMGNESDNVRTYYTNIEWAMCKAIKVKLTYEFEVNSLSKFHTVTSSFLWNF